MIKPVRLEFNNSGAWKVLGRFDVDDEDHSSLVLDAAEDLVRTLHNHEDPKRCPTLRVSHDDGLGEVIMRWDRRVHRPDTAVTLPADAPEDPP